MPNASPSPVFRLTDAPEVERVPSRWSSRRRNGVHV
jgi:hypothetical protein